MDIGRRGTLAVVAALGIIAVACGGNNGGGGGGGSKGTISIGVDLPESGAAASGGLSTLNGVKFAVQKAGGSVGGWTLTVDNYDDAVNGAYNAQKGVQNVTAIIANKQDVGMVGPYNSAVAKAEIPVTQKAHLTQISPSNTNPCLTKDIPSCHNAGNYLPSDIRDASLPENYFRVVTTDDYQGPAQADYFYDTLGIKTVGVLDEKTVFGKGIADAFQAEFVKKGGKVIRDSYDPATTTDWRNYLNKFKDQGATGLYVGGTDDQKACQPRAQMSDLSTWPYGGGDGIDTTQCIDDAGNYGIGLLSTSAGPDATQIPGAQSTIQDFKKAFTGANDYGAYTMTAYDATGIIIQAIKKALDAGKDPKQIDKFREAVRANVASTTSYQGVIGTTGFDKNGDTTLKIISVYKVQDVGATRAAAGDLVCGKNKPTLCYTWVKQVNYAG